MAYFRSDGWVKSVLGQAIAGAQIYVCTQPADVSYVPPIPQAAIYSDSEGLLPITQPLATDGFGHYDFYVAYGTYTVVVVTGGNIQQVYPDQTIGFTGGSGNVTSVFGRAGDITAQAGDYSVAQVTGAAPLASPSFSGTVQIINAVFSGTIEDGSGSVGTSGQVLSSTGTKTLWITGVGSGTVTSVSAGTGLTASPSPIVTSGTISLADTAVTPTSYTNANITVNQQGQITAASNGNLGVSVNTQTASYVAVLGDANNLVVMNVSSANIFTVPKNTTINFPVGTTLTVQQFGTGQVTLTPASGVTINTPASFTARVQFSTVSLVQVATDVWVAGGDLT